MPWPRALVRARHGMPVPACSPRPHSVERQAEHVARTALSLFQRHVSAPFNLTLVNLGATNFKQARAAGREGGGGSVKGLANQARLY